MSIVTIGIDLAKNVFAIHGVDATGQAVLAPCHAQPLDCS
jgi:transposase